MTSDGQRTGLRRCTLSRLRGRQIRHREAPLKTRLTTTEGATAQQGAVQARSEKEVSIPIGGMTCAACARTIERVVGKLDGVASVSVNFATEKALVRYETSAVRLSEIKQAVAKAGYTPLAVEAGTGADEHREVKEREIRVLWSKFIRLGGVRPAPARPCDGPDARLAPAGGDRPHGTSPPLRTARGGLGAPHHRGGSPLLRRRLQGHPAAEPEHGLAHRDGDVGGDPLQRPFRRCGIARGEAGAMESLYFETAGVIITLMLLGKSLEAVVQGADLGVDEEAHGPPAEDRHRDPRGRRRRSSPSRRSRRVTSSGSGPARGSRSTARSSRAAPRSTSRCSRGRACPSRRRSARRSSAGA